MGFISDSQKIRPRPPGDRGQETAQVGIQYPSVSYQANPYKLTDMPIVLEGDSSAVELNDFAGPRSPGSEASAMDSSDVASPQSLEREQEPHRGFDERIPLSLSLHQHCKLTMLSEAWRDD
jgi:hypothetical protein